MLLMLLWHFSFIEVHKLPWGLPIPLPTISPWKKICPLCFCGNKPKETIQTPKYLGIKIFMTTLITAKIGDLIHTLTLLCLCEFVLPLSPHTFLNVPQLGILSYTWTLDKSRKFIFSNQRKAEYSDTDGWRWVDEVVGVCGSSLLIVPILPGK